MEVKMTFTCEIARTPMEHGECHASTCQCPCHNGLGGICDCAEKRAIEEAKNFKVEKAQWLKIIEPELREQMAREILEIGIPELPQGYEGNLTFISIRTAQEVMRLRAAAIVRGDKE